MIAAVERERGPRVRDRGTCGRSRGVIDVAEPRLVSVTARRRERRIGLSSTEVYARGCLDVMRSSPHQPRHGMVAGVACAYFTALSPQQRHSVK
jgi:hypothetical protein